MSNPVRPIPDRLEDLTSELRGPIKVDADGNVVFDPDVVTPQELSDGLAGKADVGHRHADLSTVIPAGQLWGGQGDGVPAPVPIGRGLAIADNQLQTAEDYAKAADLATLAARTSALGDFGRVLLWDTGTGGGEPAGNAPTGQAWRTITQVGDYVYTREQEGLKPSRRATQPLVADVGSASVDIEASFYGEGLGISLIFFAVLADPEAGSYIRVTIGSHQTSVFLIRAYAFDGTTDRELFAKAVDPVPHFPGWQRPKLLVEPATEDQVIYLSLQHSRGTTEHVIDDPDLWQTYSGNTVHGVGISHPTSRVRDIVIRRA